MTHSPNFWKTWWNQLSQEWQDLLIDQLDLRGMFSPSCVEYVLTLSELDCSGYCIKDLGPIEMLINIRKLYLNESCVTDLSPLKTLPHLEELHATFSEVTCWKVLTELKQLAILDISYPKHISGEELNVISKLKSLRELYLNLCEIETVDPLIGLDSLEVLSLCFNSIPPEEIAAYSRQKPAVKVLY